MSEHPSILNPCLQGYYPPPPQQAYGGQQPGYYPQPQAQPVSATTESMLQGQQRQCNVSAFANPASDGRSRHIFSNVSFCYSCTDTLLLFLLFPYCRCTSSRDRRKEEELEQVLDAVPVSPVP